MKSEIYTLVMLSMLTLLVWCLVAVSRCHASPVTFAWNDAAPADQAVTEYRIYKAVPGGRHERVATTSTLTATVEALPGEVFTLTAVNSVGESDHSNALRLAGPVLANVSFETSSNLVTWEQVVPVYSPITATRFFRAKITTP